MAEVTKFHIGDIVYCLNTTGEPVRAIVRTITVTSCFVSLSVGVQDAFTDRYNPEDYMPFMVAASECFATLDELLDHQITKLKDRIRYWESFRKDHKE